MTKQNSIGKYVNLNIKGDLFSDYYIEKKLSKDLTFEKITKESENILEKVLKIYQNNKSSLKIKDESSLEEDFIKPILSELGHTWDVQCPLVSHMGVEEKPDYALFPNSEIKQMAQKQEDSDLYFKKSIGLIEAKKWIKNLDKGYKRNPSLQIKRYLRLTQVEWGILTNGKKWRLYNKKSSFSSNVYLELDLEEILEYNNDLFEYFYAFFSHDAFKKENGECFLDHVHEQNIQFSSEVKKELDKNVYKALKTLTQGFLNYSKNDLHKEDLDIIHDNCLIILYRLLFLFYAESKKLLSYSKHSERYSIVKISDEVSKEVKKSATFAPLENRYWQRLKKTFNLIDQGSEEVLGEKGIPAYNGGLFDKDQYPFLNNKEIGDTYIVKAIHLLAYRRKNNNFSRVDYATLKIKHLGAIYEKLLEYKLKIADSNLGIKNGEYYEAEYPSEIKIQKGDVYLLTDKGERKATGSYFTPDYIVQYIVEKMIGSVIEKRISIARENGVSEAKEILNLKILDPAMGSGHFLVDSVEFMAEEFLKALERDHESRERTDESNNKAMSIEEFPYDIEWAKRKIVQNCIFGVDKNPLATELAKVALWLTTISMGKPLSFLDHHLKVGNSLIGADFISLNNHPSEKSKQEKDSKEIYRLFKNENFDIKEVVEDMLRPYKEIKTSPEEKPKDINKKKLLYNKVRENKIYKKLKILADVYISFFFGNDYSKADYKNLKNALNDDEKWNKIVKKQWVKKATNFLSNDDKIKNNLADKYRFFHWFLEFPEAFFDFENGEIEDNAGFDIVMGNPPYVRQEIITEFKDYFRKNYDVYTGRGDLYFYFIERGSKLASELLGFIVSHKFTKVNSGEVVRKYIVEKTFLKEFIHFHDLPVFGEDITTYPAIIILSKKNNVNKFLFAELEDLDFSSLPNKILELGKKISLSNLNEKEWKFMSDLEKHIRKKVQNKGGKLSKLIGEPMVGVKTGLNSVLIVDKKQKEKIIKNADDETFLYI